MQIRFNFKSFEPSDHLRDYAEKRFDKLNKYIHDTESADIQVNLEVEKIRQMAEVVVNADGNKLSAFEESEDMYSTIDMALDKVEAQLRKIRDKAKKKHRMEDTKPVRMDVFSYVASESGEQVRNIVKTDHYEPKPMTVDEAAMQLETLEYEFLVFYNAENDSVNVIYKRRNGDFGLIDPGMY
ncbi:ribosome hibernation-promoting factor, HPF/YfiA family [Desulfohalobium retbaense]|uniref:Ribosome hibernation promoting factor n=1 Tax=Desulfohalobium retbaense (strain ATCC 49708 / DSM 5692 / JCM 16813 / HR100) TaxID=485915 RepID=C8X387_DESRD|nr:ribosome-associated translation inhibitor RaiA [Desulfohalobium retbaense]ACV68884.1 sigma 54 modulation protein/ribosomal protein S30EA [Desulfohalobium retbaense DSM 5692]